MRSEAWIWWCAGREAKLLPGTSGLFLIHPIWMGVSDANSGLEKNEMEAEIRSTDILPILPDVSKVITGSLHFLTHPWTFWYDRLAPTFLLTKTLNGIVHFSENCIPYHWWNGLYSLKIEPDHSLFLNFQIFL